MDGLQEAAGDCVQQGVSEGPLGPGPVRAALVPYLESPQKPCELGCIFLTFKMRKLAFRQLRTYVRAQSWFVVKSGLKPNITAPEGKATYLPENVCWRQVAHGENIGFAVLPM